MKKFDVLSALFTMSLTLLFIAMGHVMFADSMALMIPDIIPARKFWVYPIGVFEIAMAMGLQGSRFRKRTGWLLVFILTRRHLCCDGRS